MRPISSRAIWLVALAVVFAFGGIAFAAASDDGTEPPETTEVTEVDDDADEVEVEEPEVDDVVDEADQAGEGEALENHGHCVSFWAHESKGQGLKGSARGHFVSSVALDPEAVALKDEPGETCDFQAQLDEALAAQEAVAAEASAPKHATAKSKGGKGKGRGKHAA
jgi:hypothetical protein